MVQIWPGLFVCKQVTVCPGHIWTTLYLKNIITGMKMKEYKKRQTKESTLTGNKSRKEEE
jgi:hypothetical protein